MFHASPSADLPGAAHAGRLVADALAAFLPPAPVSVAEWAAEHRWITGSRPGRWDPTVAPYLTEPMEVLSAGTHTTVALVGPAQCGKNALAENWLLASIDADPGDMLWYMQTDDAIRSYVKDRINPLIEAHDQIAAKQGPRAIDDSLSFKRFRGMSVHFLPATHSSVISKTARKIVADEWDAYDPAFGDPLAVLNPRRSTYGRDSMLLASSHPDLAGGSDEIHWRAGIMSLYAGSDRRTWWWRCPHCDAVSSPNPGTARQMVLHYPQDAPLDAIAAETRLLCPVNGCLIEDHHRRAMNRGARWICKGQSIDEDGVVTGSPIAADTAGFWIVGVMSPFLLNGIGGLARARVEADRNRQVTGDDRTLRSIMVKGWGIPYDPPRNVGQVDADALAQRSEPGLIRGLVPHGVRFLTAAIDVQANRFEYLVRGWGVEGESWVIDHQQVEADPATSQEDWDGVIGKLAGAAYPLADGSGRTMRILAIGFDSGGQAGVTTQAYDAWRRARKTKAARRLGKIDGRDAWTLLPLKGAASFSAPRLTVTYPDTARRDRNAGARGEIPLGTFAPNRFKDDLANQLARAAAGPWSVHLPAEPIHIAAGIDPDTASKLRLAWFGQLIAETRNANGVWQKSNPQSRNELLDLMVMTHVMAILHGIQRLHWSSPPAWASEWGSNALVSNPITPQPPIEVVPAASSAQAPPAVLAVHNAPPPLISRADGDKPRSMGARMAAMLRP